MDVHDLAYALDQVVHNFGAVAVTAGSAAARWSQPPGAARRRLAWLVLSGWAVQAASGASFGTISYLTFGRLPDIHGIAVAALLLKVACAIAGASGTRAGGATRSRVRIASALESTCAAGTEAISSSAGGAPSLLQSLGR